MKERSDEASLQRGVEHTAAECRSEENCLTFTNRKESLDTTPTSLFHFHPYFPALLPPLASLHLLSFHHPFSLSSPHLTSLHLHSPLPFLAFAFHLTSFPFIPSAFSPSHHLPNTPLLIFTFTLLTICHLSFLCFASWSA